MGVLLARYGDNQDMYESLCRNAKVFVGSQMLSAKFREFARQVDEVWVMSSYPLILFHLIRRWLPQARLSLAVYHPDEYCWPQRSPKAIRKLMSSTWERLPPSNVYFMNETCRARHAEAFGEAFLHSPILPLFISLEPTVTTRTLSGKMKIVSVGRITGFKTYNFTMLPIIARLAQEFPVEYHIYGDGELMHQLSAKVRDMGLQQIVILHGAISYKERLTPYADAYAFVGMGLSLVEAASCSVPAVVAIEGDHDSYCYGLFSELLGLNVGEMDIYVPRYLMEEELRSILKLKEADYIALSVKHHEKTIRFSNDGVIKFVDAFLEKNAASSLKTNPGVALIALFQIAVVKLLEKIGYATWHSGRYGKKRN